MSLLYVFDVITLANGQLNGGYHSLNRYILPRLWKKSLNVY